MVNLPYCKFIKENKYKNSEEILSISPYLIKRIKIRKIVEKKWIKV